MPAESSVESFVDYLRSHAFIDDTQVDAVRAEVQDAMHSTSEDSSLDLFDHLRSRFRMRMSTQVRRRICLMLSELCGGAENG